MADPIRAAWMDVCYKGTSPDVGDLWCHREEPGVIATLWRPTPEELTALLQGGAIAVVIHTEPIPPLGVTAVTKSVVGEVLTHNWKEIPELNDEERTT
jgi:hypothetical protein